MVKKMLIDENVLVDAVGEGVIINKDTSYGRLIPVIILDVQNNKHIFDIILLQYKMGQGKVTTTWSIDNKISKAKKVILVVNFTEPVNKEFAISFDIENYKAPIDCIVNSQLLYIQPGKKGDKVSDTINNPKILIEVPSKDFKDNWIKILKRNFKGSQGQFDTFYKKWSSFRNFRFK